MANITIRNLDDETHAALKERAALSGRSMEAEARAILRRALPAGNSARTLLDAMAHFREVTGGLTKEEHSRLSRSSFRDPRPVSFD